AVALVDTGSVVYAGLGASIFKSTDGAVTWSSTGFSGGAAVHSLAADPNNAGEILAGTDSGVWRSTDGGASWQASSGLPVDAVTSLVYAAGAQYAGIDDDSVYKSLDHGHTWQATSPFPVASCDDTFTGASGGDWNDGSNWSAGVPGSSTVAC